MAGVPAGRLSIEIVAEIARLQQDLDKAKRAVAAASGDIAKSAMHANDNLAGMGRAMNGVGTTSRAMRANMINLGRQVQDVGTMFAMGASPMQIFASQGAQIVDVLAMMRVEAAAANTSLTRMAAGGLVKISPYALAAAAAGGTLALVLQDITDEINENSDVTVTWGDTLLGTFDAVVAFVGGAVTNAFEALGIDMGAIFDAIAANVKKNVNEIIGMFVFAVNAIKAAWRTFPAAFAEFVVNAANGAINALEGLINSSIRLLNMFVVGVNTVVGTSLATISEINIPEIANRWRGAGAAAGQAMAQAQGNAYRDYLGDFADYVSPFAQARARRRMEADAEQAGRSTGRAAGRAAGQAMAEEMAMTFEEAFADLIAEIELADRVRAENGTLRERLAGLEREAQAIGLVGYERDQLLLTLEYQADAQALLARMAIAESNGQLLVVQALREQLALRRAVYDQQTSNAANDNEVTRMQERWGEMDAWLQQVNLSAEQMQMAFEQIRMDGLDSLTDGLVDVMTGFRSLGDVARSVLSQILSDMLRLQIQQSIMGPLSQALGMMGSAGAGPSAGLLGSVTQAFAANPGLFAKGTLSAPAGLAIVGEQGPELVNLRGGERIYPAGQTQQMLGTSNTINVNVSGAMNPQQARETGDQIGRRIRQQMNGRAA